MINFAQNVPKATQERPKGAPKCPKSVHNYPESASKKPRGAQKWPKSRLKWAQERPKVGEERPKVPQEQGVGPTSGWAPLLARTQRPPEGAGGFLVYISVLNIWRKASGVFAMPFSDNAWIG